MRKSRQYATEEASEIADELSEALMTIKAKKTTTLLPSKMAMEKRVQQLLLTSPSLVEYLSQCYMQRRCRLLMTYNDLKKKLAKAILDASQ